MKHKLSEPSAVGREEKGAKLGAGVYGSAIRLLSRIRLTAWLLGVWTALGAAALFWGYRSIMASCPPEDDFAGCFEPPYRFAANVFFLFWGAVEAALLAAWIMQRWAGRTAKRDAADTD